MHRAQYDAVALHPSYNTTDPGSQHAAPQDERSGRAQRPATVSEGVCSRSQGTRGCTKRGRDLGIFPSGGSQVPGFFRSSDDCPRAFVNGTADSGELRRRSDPCHSGRGSPRASTASLLAPLDFSKTIVHKGRNELGAGTACCDSGRRPLRPRVLEASAHRLILAATLRSPSRVSSGGAWREGDVSRFACAHSF
ncbi:uncharacterized protein LOC142568511 [Dermacentor variabilis]|uniref:uncharacterized protein LOC142568511 n=1 Tax=Dermacentor variabilis TaxID=34621 RepID=UPI003F5B7A4D